MNLDRRTVLKSLFIIAGGVTLIPSCMQKDNAKASINLKHLDVSASDEQLLAELTETIIPKTDTPGAKDTYTHLYILKMVDDCSTKDDQKKFTRGLEAFDKFARNKTQRSFAELSPAQRDQLVLQIENEKEIPENVIEFYKGVKALSIQGYTSSKFYLTTVQAYELVPGRFYGCIPVSASRKNNKAPKLQA